jgi:hypothetical protein
MTPIKKPALAAVVLGSMLAGGAIGVAMFGPLAATAQTGETTTTTAAPPSNGAAPNAAAPKAGSNEDPTHEKGESLDREKAEDSGTAFAGPRHGGAPNEDPTHEKSESPEREAAEHPPAGSTTPTPAPAPAAPTTPAA